MCWDALGKGLTVQYDLPNMCIRSAFNTSQIIVCA